MYRALVQALVAVALVAVALAVAPATAVVPRRADLCVNWPGGYVRCPVKPVPRR